MIERQVKTGVDGLDRILFGGIPQGNTVLVEGRPGAGKTILGMQFLYYGSVHYNEPGIYITFEEFPDQIYKDMKQFGWDIQKLEKENKLRVITLSPEVLMDQIMKPDGLFDRLVKEIGCKRIVVDSISLFQYYYSSQIDQRKVIYTLRNTLRKYGLTSILLKEIASVEEENISFVNYLVDGVISLNLTPHFENYRKRILEITKMRGSKIQEGEHLYRITENGLHLIPALTLIEDELVTTSNHVISTGLPNLDQTLDGGIHSGATFTIDTNSKSNYKYLVIAITANHIQAGDKVLIILSSLSTISQFEEAFKKFNIDLQKLAKEGKVVFVEHYKRSAPLPYKDAVIHVSDLDNEQYRQTLQKELFPMMANGEKWFVYYDLNTVATHHGYEYVKRFFGVEVARVNSICASMLVLTNFKELGEETASFIERSSHGVIRTWVDGNYQFLQVTKSPNGKISEPLVLEKINDKPFIRLV
ncbi:ATPase domain-containing protein [Radiobacillus deserti]|uniref:Circadian clock protein KaiC n=1 Tax=Radiobacillus deserti TaxID=2594883 RepID=A0A516KDR6_9BACI|nr:ATPase domain-containing protein [Radiobacillus deserti]QDP39545.1 circadian clock protein KaiC [Radiobacillus deserti]